MPKDKYHFYFLLYLATLGVCLGRAWQHLAWDAPYRVLLWDEAWMRAPVEGLLGISWQTWTTDTSMDERIGLSIKIIGWVYLFIAFVATLRYWATIKPQSFIKWLPKLEILAALNGCFLAALYCKDKWFHVGQFFEYALQIGAPLFFLYFPKHSNKKMLWNGMLLATLLTFACHGLYALGYYPQPENFVTMTLNCLHCDETTARVFLKIMGWLDILVVLVFGFEFLVSSWFRGAASLPTANRQPTNHLRTANLLKIALLYCIIWGFLTCIARVWAYFYIDFWQDSLNQNLYQLLYRVPHFLVPCVLWWRRKNAIFFLL